jgi:hypothetical protein
MKSDESCKRQVLLVGIFIGCVLVLFVYGASHRFANTQKQEIYATRERIYSALYDYCKAYLGDLPTYCGDIFMLQSVIEVHTAASPFPIESQHKGLIDKIVIIFPDHDLLMKFAKVSDKALAQSTNIQSTGNTQEEKQVYGLKQYLHQYIDTKKNYRGIRIELWYYIDSKDKREKILRHKCFDEGSCYDMRGG